MIVINSATPKNPITLIGECIGPCYGSDTSDPEKNYKRGLNSIKAGHGRVLEYANAWFTISGYSARVIREFYTHIGGAPTRTQASTRYINESNFDYYKPFMNEQASALYEQTMENINLAYKMLTEDFGISKEDAANVLPLGMYTTVSCHMNARTLMTMAEQRLCTRAYKEYRILMYDIILALSQYSNEWATLCEMVMKVKCDKAGFCEEEFSCGCWPKKDIDE